MHPAPRRRGARLDQLALRDLSGHRHPRRARHPRKRSDAARAPALERALGPTGVAIDDAGARAVVWSQFDGKLSVVDLGTDGDRPAKAVAVRYEPAPEVAASALGRELFHRVDNCRISNDGVACASCHPEGREDAFTWATPEGPRQTIMLAGRAKATAPYGWQGKHGDLKAYLGNTFSRLGGSGLHGGELEAMVGYLETLPGPGQADRKVDATEIARGKELFNGKEQGCASCHIEGAGIDAAGHDVGSMTAADVDGKFDTPSLRFIRGSGPYFHDGRYPTLRDLLSAQDSRMGHTAHLSQRDVQSLAAYLETLDQGTPPMSGCPAGAAARRRWCAAAAELILCATLGLACSSPAASTAAGGRPPSINSTARLIALAGIHRQNRELVDGARREQPDGVALDDDVELDTGDHRRRGAQRARARAVASAARGAAQGARARDPGRHRTPRRPGQAGPTPADLEVRANGSAPTRVRLANGRTFNWQPGLLRAQAVMLRARSSRWRRCASAPGWVGPAASSGAPAARWCLAGPPPAPSGRPRSSWPPCSPRRARSRCAGKACVEPPGGVGLEYRVVDGWFDERTCRAVEARRSTTPMLEVVPGVLYAFVDRCDCGVAEVLTLVMPSARNVVSTQTGGPRLAELRGTFTRVRLPLGTADESMMAHLGADDVAAWSRALGQSARLGGAPAVTARATGSPADGGGVFVAVEVSGAVGARDANAMAFVERGRRDGDVPDHRPRDPLATYSPAR